MTQHHRHQQHNKCNDASSPVACSNFWSTPSQSILARAVISAMNAAISEIASTSTSDHIQEHQTQLLSAAPAPVPAAAPNRARLPGFPASPLQHPLSAVECSPGRDKKSIICSQTHYQVVFPRPPTSKLSARRWSVLSGIKKVPFLSPCPPSKHSRCQH